MSEEASWQSMVERLQAMGITLEKIAEKVGVSVRTVSRWKTHDEPLGMNAVRLWKLYEQYGAVDDRR